MQDTSTNVIRFNGVGCIRQRLALSMITQKPIFINNIRRGSKSGITDYESNLLKLLDKIMNGSTIQINENGTSVYFKPGSIIGGKITHMCNNERDIGYYLECIILILPFLKNDLELTLQGITNGYEDPSIDRLQYCVIPILKHFGVDEDIKISIVKRSAAPLGGGIIKFYCPVIKQLKNVKIENIGYVKRIRGCAYSMRVSPTLSNRTIDGAKSILTNYIGDVFITQDHCKLGGCGISPGFGIALYAETTTGMCITSEASSKPKTTNNNNASNDTVLVTPEEVGKNAALQLLDNIYYQSCVELSQQHLILYFMAISPAHVSKVILYQPNSYTVELLKHLEIFLGVVFKIELVRNGSVSVDDKEMDKNEDTSYDENRFVFSCVGSGVMNYNRAIC